MNNKENINEIHRIDVIFANNVIQVDSIDKTQKMINQCITIAKSLDFSITASLTETGSDAQNVDSEHFSVSIQEPNTVCLNPYVAVQHKE